MEFSEEEIMNPVIKYAIIGLVIYGVVSLGAAGLENLKENFRGYGNRTAIVK